MRRVFCFTRLIENLSLRTACPRKARDTAVRRALSKFVVVTLRLFLSCPCRFQKNNRVCVQVLGGYMVCWLSSCYSYPRPLRLFVVAFVVSVACCCVGIRWLAWSIGKDAPNKLREYAAECGAKLDANINIRLHWKPYTYLPWGSGSPDGLIVTSKSPSSKTLFESRQDNKIANLPVKAIPLAEKLVPNLRLTR